MSKPLISVTKELISEVERCMRSGLSVQGTCRIIDISRRTWYSWKDKSLILDDSRYDDYRTLFKAVKHALGQFELELVTCISSNGDWKAKQAILKRRFSESWDEKFEDLLIEKNSELAKKQSEIDRLENEINELIEIPNV